MGRINFNNDVEYDTEDKKFKLTRGMLIIGACLLVGIIVLIIVIVNVVNSDKKEATFTEADFLKLERRMEEEAPLYVSQKQIVLTEKTYKIDLKDLLIDKGGTIVPSKNPAVEVCDGYVLASKVESELYNAYISCGKYYETSEYLSNDSVDKPTTTKKQKDKEKPDLLLKGDKTITINVGEKYNEPGFTAIDNIDKDITSKVIVTGTVDINKAGEYTLTYSVSDNSGNITSDKRIVKVIESAPTTTQRPGTTTQAPTTTRPTTTRKPTTTKVQEMPKVAPTITLYGSRIITLYVGDEYKDPGYSAKDCMGADITASVNVSGAVNTKVATTYRITYSVTDRYDNKNTITRTIIVKAKNKPVEGISISPNYIELQKGKTKELAVYINPSNATNKSITWSSSNNSIASVSNGIVTANAKGVATITAKTSNGKSYSVRVEVK